MSVVDRQIFMQGEGVGKIVRAGREIFTAIDAQAIGRKSDKYKFNRAALSMLENMLSRQKTLAQILIRHSEIDALNVGKFFKIKSAFREAVKKIFSSVTSAQADLNFDKIKSARDKRISVDDIVFGHAISRQKTFELSGCVFA